MTTPDFTPAERHALGQLNRATEWVIHWGRFVMARKGFFFTEAKLREQTGADLWSEPYLDTQDKIALFQLKAGGYFYDVEAIHADEIDGVLYEYWVVHVEALEYATPVMACLFYVTAAREDHEMGAFGARRDILKGEGQFFDSYRTESGEVFALPLDDLKIRHALQAWDYPGCFPGSDLPLTRVIAGPDGSFRAEPFAPAPQN